MNFTPFFRDLESTMFQGHVLIISFIYRLEAARTVVSPLLTVAAIDLMSNCLDSREATFWKSLGSNWNLPQ